VGKAADNEILKLKAAYFNNIGVGAFIAGIAAPGVAFTLEALDPSSERGYRAIIIMAMSLMTSVIFRRMSDSFAKRIQD
jgi:hypothetical protein